MHVCAFKNVFETAGYLVSSCYFSFGIDLEFFIPFDSYSHSNPNFLFNLHGPQTFEQLLHGSFMGGGEGQHYCDFHLKGYNLTYLDFSTLELYWYKEMFNHYHKKGRSQNKTFSANSLLEQRQHRFTAEPV